MKKLFKGILTLALLIAFVGGGYIAYLQINYYRIEDNTELEIGNQKYDTLKVGSLYSVMTYNIGFGAYDHEYSFFMDKGKMKSGEIVQGKYGKARSKESVEKNTAGAISIIEEYKPDFCIMQEVDSASTRSHFVDQKAVITKNAEYSYNYGNNFHSGYLCYPLSDPHGSVEAGLLSLSKYHISKALRRSYPITTDFFAKFFDLDRCFVAMRIPTDNGKELVLINSHLSAYDEGGTIRKQQFEMLRDYISKEYESGNYVIVGGDFNHALGGTVGIFASEQEVPEWVSVMSDEDIPENFTLVKAQNISEVPTCRSTDIAYQKGVNYTAVLDGFIISDNIEAEATNIDNDFMFSDHNPVVMKFRMK
ncbi:MAG: endonuclease/exonuclease/phosphatase family protein [Bacteroidales bacterium]|nr:endonuclease/exonuclease/phosphatase family protein [Bacteroidales bacterium]